MQRVRPLVRALTARSSLTVSQAFNVAKNSSLRESWSGPSWNPLHPTRASSPPLQCLKIPCQHFLGFGDGDEDSGLSRRYEEQRLIGYSPEQLFAVVAAVDLYEDFVPWCRRSTVLWRKGEERLEAELEIGFKFLVERYISHVELRRPTLIKTSVSRSKLFDYLNNIWDFRPGPVPGSCHLHFFVNFQFRSPLYREVANMFFDEVVARLVGSFEERCATVYGPGTKIHESSHVA